MVSLQVFFIKISSLRIDIEKYYSTNLWNSLLPTFQTTQNLQGKSLEVFARPARFDPVFSPAGRGTAGQSPQETVPLQGGRYQAAKEEIQGS